MNVKTVETLLQPASKYPHIVGRIHINAKRTFISCYGVSRDCTISNDFPFVVERLS